jgi:hypothetical protein
MDGVDNDCNGVVDDVPLAPPTLLARALLLIPDYDFSDAAREVDHIASVLDQWGVAYDRPSKTTDFDAALPTLARYPLVIIPGYLEDDFLVPLRQAALEGYVEQGGVLVVFRPAFKAGSATHGLTGTSSIEARSDVDSIGFDGPPLGAIRLFDSPEEVLVPINRPTSGGTVSVHVLTPANATTQALATALVGGVPVGAAVTRRLAGKGLVYSLGYDLHSSLAERCYINCFEPTGDLVGLFLREAFREAMQGHVVLKHTVPGVEDSVVLFSHDLDAYDAQQYDPAWGDPGALQVAAAEQAAGARGSFFVTTQDVQTTASRAYYSPELMQKLCAIGLCPVGAHSVVHGRDFAQLPLGTCDETADGYAAATSPTLCGEVRVSMARVAAATGASPIGWRSPYLDINKAQYDVLAGAGVLFDASYAIGDLKSNLPLSLANTGLNQQIFHHQPLYSLPIVLEDGIGGTVEGVSNREEMSASNIAKFVSLWSYALLRNADNGAHTLALLHPSRGLNQPPDNVRNKVTVLKAVLQVAATRGLHLTATAADLVNFWRAREEVAMDASFVGGDAPAYIGTIRTGVHEAPDLTIEFGDTIAGFDCGGCASLHLAGKRVTLQGKLPPMTTIAFRATIGLPPTPPAP